MPLSDLATWAPTRRLIAVLAAATFAAACGGGGDDNDSVTEVAAASAEGLYVGTVAGGTPNYFEKLVLENNEVWIAYGTRATPTAGISLTGSMSGTGSYSGGTLTAATFKDFGVSPVATGTFSGSYRINTRSSVKSVSGTVNAGSKSLTVTGNNNLSNYIYNLPASLSDIAGNWSLPISGVTGTMSVNSSGGFSLNIGGCAASGTLVPRPSGKNVFNVALTFGGAPCALPGVAFSGVAIVATGGLLDPGTSTNLRLFIRNSTQTTGFAFVGSR